MFTASVGFTPTATLVRFCAAPGAAPVPPDATSASWFDVAVLCTVPPLATAVLSLPSAASTVLKAEVTLFAAPDVPSIVLALARPKLVPLSAPVVVL